MEREAEDVLAVLDAVDGRLLVGHSYGALCSILAAQRTDRLERLVLYEPPIAVQPAWLEGLDELVATGDLDEALERFLRAAGTSDEHLEHDPQLARVARPPRGRPAAAARAAGLHRLAGAGGADRGPDPLPARRGDDQPRLPRRPRDLLAAFTNLRRETIEGQMHVAHVFDAERFAERVAAFVSDV